MKRLCGFLTFVALSCAAFANLKVVTTTPDLASIAAAVGGENVSVSSILVGARDPHRIEAKPSYMSRVASADVFIAVGLDLEIGYEQAILDGSRNAKVQKGKPGHIHAADWVYVMDKPMGSVNRGMGDIHPDGNPHIWLDPYNGRVIAQKLAERFSSLDRSNARAYEANADRFADRLDNAMFGQLLVGKFGGQKLWDWQRNGVLSQRLRENGAADDLGGWAKAMAPFAGREIITYHKSFNYFCARFGLKVLDELEPKPGIDPSPGHLAQVIRLATTNGVKAIVQENFYSTKHAKLVASRCGASVVVVPQNVGHEKAADDYIGLFDVIVGRVAGALR